MSSGVILLVEDEGILLWDVEQSLVEAGFEVASAFNAATAIETFDLDPERISAVLTDIRLGEGATGWDIARHARVARPTLPIVYMSGHGADDWPSEGVPNSIMISKPFVMAQVITALATLLNSASSLGIS
ncbi:response regulator [Mesorhizobium sp. B2-1-8]|uniref:response regulator n=1 Tax=unclassified Mesorhizobium TaxID=325217 RepID=UPI00112C3ABC|nr:MULTISPECIES: response regulator [unclassified Mesorhizobium]MBZ9669060.1 response regulator [Mesorhizobium sp. ES1-3]UCI17318.1 response regulator [Mesorhizobium sp. B2-1-8]